MHEPVRYLTIIGLIFLRIAQTPHTSGSFTVRVLMEMEVGAVDFLMQKIHQTLNQWKLNMA